MNKVLKLAFKPADYLLSWPVSCCSEVVKNVEVFYVPEQVFFRANAADLILFRRATTQHGRAHPTKSPPRKTRPEPRW